MIQRVFTHTELVQRVIHCKICMRMIRKHQASQLGKTTSAKKARASRKNGRLGGRPIGS